MFHLARNLVIGFATLGVLTGAVPASDPVAAYLLVDRVVMVDDGVRPATIEIWGAFQFNGGVIAATRGYLYYTLNANERATRAEWADLQAIAGTKQVVGFGARGAAIGRVRRPPEGPAKPDVYPVGIGLVRVPATSSGLYAMLFQFPNMIRHATAHKSPQIQ